MAIYYAIVDGDPLTSGPNSRVYAPSTSCFIDGDDGRQRSMAYIGDKAYCEKCKSTGIIIGGARVDNNQRMIDLEDGRRQAVGGDYVLCKCPERPQVIARYGRNWMIEDDGGASTTAGAKAASTSNASPATDDELEHYFEIVDAATEAPIEGMTYKLLSDGVSLVDNESLAAGKTMAFSKSDHPNLSLIAWRTGDVR